MTQTLAETLAERLLQSIIDGELPPASSLPPEGELALANGVSRLTVREAVRILRTQNVVRIRRGRGTEVNPPTEWTSLAAIMRASAANPAQAAATSERLLEARRMIEIGAAQLAAAHRTDAQLDQLQQFLDEMIAASERQDVPAFVEADIQFHNVIMRATKNEFVPLLFDTFGPLLTEARRQTSAVPEIQRNAIERHDVIIAALRSGDPEQSRVAMEQHMSQTQRDLRTHVINTVSPSTVTEESLTAMLPPPTPVSATELDAALQGRRRLVVLDDDPTGTQSISDLPVLTRWGIDDIRWALQQPTTTLFILTNTRSLSAAAAADRTREVARACLEAARLEFVDIAFASRSDSTLRGHFPLEPEQLASVSGSYGQSIDAVIISPAYIDAGRVTIDSVHWVRTPQGMQPVSSSDYAADATFGFKNSYLPAWVQEKTEGRLRRDEVERITLVDLRNGGPDEVATRLSRLSNLTMVVADALTDDDLYVLTLGILKAEKAGKRFLYRVGPSFVRARAGQTRQPPISTGHLSELLGGPRPGRPGGLIVVGSHVSLTSRQVRVLTDRKLATELEIDVQRIVNHSQHGAYLLDMAEQAARLLRKGHVVLKTTREVLTGGSGDESLSIARQISQGLVDIVRQTVSRERPAFIVAKGGITSSDVATEGLDIRQAWVRGALLPGIVSLWEPASGPAKGLPFVVFAGNVGDDESLADVVERFDQS